MINKDEVEETLGRFIIIDTEKPSKHLSKTIKFQPLLSYYCVERKVGSGTYVRNIKNINEAISYYNSIKLKPTAISQPFQTQQALIDAFHQE